MYRFTRNLSLVLAVILMLTALPLAASAQDDQEARIRENINRIVEEGFNQGNADVLDELLAPDYVSYLPGESGTEGIAEFKETIAFFRTIMPDLTATVDPIIVEGNWAAFRLVMQGTFSGTETDFPPPTNQPVTFTANIIARFDEEGRIVEEWDEFDNLAFGTQFGFFDPSMPSEEPTVPAPGEPVTPEMTEEPAG